jgi:hypothetical protein
VISDQANPLVLQNGKVLIGKDIDTGQDSRVGAEWFEQKQQSDNKRPELCYSSASHPDCHSRSGSDRESSL